MLRIDAHQHFWQFDPVRDNWISDDMKLIQRNFMPGDLLPLLQQSGLNGCVAVQSDQSSAENAFHLSLAAQYDFIKGIVGWVDLKAGDIEHQLDALSRFEKLKGFRHVLQGEKDDAFMLHPDFMRGIAALQPYGFTYDILIFPHHLPYAKKLVAAFPDQLFVIDHLAKPYIRNKTIDDWKTALQEIAVHENVWCKVSGMVTEADWKHWRKDEFTPYMDAVFQAFGSSRVMFGSDWPVCLVAAAYDEVVHIVQDYLYAFSADEQAAVMGGNAAAFYRLT